MLRVRIAIDGEGVLRSLRAEGHTGFAAKGTDTVCAAASVLLLTAARTFEATEGFVVEGDTESRGILRLELRRDEGASTEFGRGVSQMLLKGIGDLSRRFPDHVVLTISRETEEKT